MGRPGRSLSILLFPLLFAACGVSEGPEAGISTSVETTGGGESFNNLALREVQRLDLTTSDTTLTFNASQNEEYLVVINSVSRGTENATFQVSKDSSAALTTNSGGPVSIQDPSSFLHTKESETTTSFHQWIREMEQIIPYLDGFEEVVSPSQAALTTEPEAGSKSTFRVLSTMTSITVYQEVTAELRLITDNLLVYVDVSTKDKIDDEALQTITYNFEQIALPVERQLFGRESDINLDRRITILMTPVVNRMPSFVTGFFFPGDLYQRSSINPASNAQEIFYMLVPDPGGNYGTAISTDFTTKNIIPGVLAHEFQHLVSFYQHIFKNRGTTEESWLNECVSHFAEDRTGFGNENSSRVKLFLTQTARTTLVPPTSPTLAERGACYLFLRYLYEQSSEGDAFIQRLLNTDKTGIANLEAAFQGTDSEFDEFPEFVNQWSIALSLSGTGITSDPRYNFKERSLHPETGYFTGICIRCDTQDGRGTVLDGPVVTTASTFPMVSTVTGTALQILRLKQPTGSFHFSGSEESEWTGALVRLENRE